MFHYNKLNDDILNWDGVKFPTCNRDIDRFEENNNLISINVFETDDCLNDNKIIIHRGTKNRNAKYEIDLLKVYDKGNNYHYVLVKNKSRLLNCQSNKNINKKHYCHHCLNPFSSEKAYKNHLEKGCMASEGQQTKMPDKDTYIEFQKHNTKLPCPFVIYGDFECLTTSSNNGIKGTYQEHKPCGYMLNGVSRIDNTRQPYLYRGEDCMKKFVEQLTEIKKDIFEKMNVNRPMDELTYEQKTEFRNATHCSICNKKFQPDDTKVQDHCHFTGKYRGAAHVKCNLDYSFRYFKIPIFFHNLKNYDAHLIIAKANELNIELNQNKRIDVIAQNSEKFITFSCGACQFKDSFAFLTASLDKLVRLNKYEGNEKIKNWETRFRYTSTNPYIKSKTDLNLLTEKGVYPYDYDILGLHILAPSKFSCTQAPSCLNSLRVSFKALWTVSSDSLVVLVNVCNILCHHLVLRDFLQSFSFAVAFKFRRSLDACISFHLYSLTLHFCCGDTRVRAPLSEPTASATSRDWVTTTTCPYLKAARARLINIFPSSPSSLSKMLSRTNCKRTPASDKI